MINTEDFHSSVLKIEKKSYIAIKKIGYFKINSANPITVYLVVSEIDGYIKYWK